MKLRHATTKKAAAAIARQGFRLDKADPEAKIKGVWLHTPSASPWAVLHTIRKHGARLADVVVIEVEIPRSQLRRFRRGLWYAQVNIPASAIRGEMAGAEFSGGAQ